ncbi:glycosyltransferase family protein [Pontibacter beigongshangensis]|uniref:hypothetical protein n=1 Tax=Pontibacter beigongshangensis TaxID=2574733 RepID=UPI00164F92D0|nr:hypothetical protein [Pontibacter beigongshangensis]
MKKLLIIYPNWVPSNAVGVQRVRLITNYLHQFGWEPTILTVNSKFYEEETSSDLIKIANPNIKVEYVDAKKSSKIRLYGDIALRAFGNLKRKAIEIVKEQNIDFIWTPIPPFYTALIARSVHDATGVPYAIDYIDPWVHEFPGSNNLFSRAKLATLVANILEPIAVKKVSVFTGVSEAYFLPVLKRNPKLKDVAFCGMPYGFDSNDYKVKPDNTELMWDGRDEVIPFVYAGAFLPNAHYFLNTLFEIISELRKSGELDNRIRFYFVGTSYTSLKSIQDYANENGIEDIVTENRERISYLEVLNNLSCAAGVLAIGSTEPHYTASKIFQSVLSSKPVFAVFHHLSTVVKILKDTNADQYLVKYIDSESKEQLRKKMKNSFISFINTSKGWHPRFEALDQYSAKNSAKALASVLNSKLIN